MSIIINFGILGILIVCGAWFVQRAHRFTEGGSSEHDKLESLTSLCNLDGLTADERRAISMEVESRL